MAKARRPSRGDAAIAELRAFGLALPGAHLKSPWPGHEDLAVKDKTFAYLPPVGQPFTISCKLPTTSAVALMLPYCQPTGYGLGKSGWVSATPPADAVDLEMYRAWILESYRAQAPKKLVAQLEAATPAPTRARTRSPARRTRSKA
ncbi:MAG: MmcQ/YjbR family DNA-binding protein [Kofleriaceae bacterium]|nr:MmcQ/YjbR family DNA-binding protein [Kofleriaceae bacterium]MBP6842022.1 MmcQ/YjbR family DNA-binding protein [Kofleriaceae bacterium]